MNSVSSLFTSDLFVFAIFFSTRSSCRQSFFRAMANNKNESVKGVTLARKQSKIKIDAYCQITVIKYPIGFFQSMGVL